MKTATLTVGGTGVFRAAAAGIPHTGIRGLAVFAALLSALWLRAPAPDAGAVEGNLGRDSIASCHDALLPARLPDANPSLHVPVATLPVRLGPTARHALVIAGHPSPETLAFRTNSRRPPFRPLRV